jgi:hypothetical protein
MPYIAVEVDEEDMVETLVKYGYFVSQSNPEAVDALYDIVGPEVFFKKLMEEGAYTQPQVDPESVVSVIDSLPLGAQTRIFNHMVAHKQFDPKYIGLTKISEVFESALDAKGVKG